MFLPYTVANLKALVTSVTYGLKYFKNAQLEVNKNTSYLPPDYPQNTI